MTNVILKNKHGTNVVYKGIERVNLHEEEGGLARFVKQQEWNIAYGDTPPEDTSKLWVKTSEPNSIYIGYVLPSQPTAKSSSGETSLSVLDSVLPSPFWASTCAAVDTDIYLFGGINGNSALKTIYSFDSTTKMITTLPTTLDQGAYDLTCAAIGADIYVFGAKTQDKLSLIYHFDSTTKTLTKLSVALIRPYAEMTCASIGTDIYLFGGRVGMGSSDAVNNQIFKFDSITQTITTLSTTMSSTGSRRACASIDTDIFMFGGVKGGTSSGGQTSQLIGDILDFDSLTQTITTIGTLSTPRDSIGCAAIATDIYLFGGNFPYGPSSAIQCFDTLTQTFKSVPVSLPTFIHSIACASIDDDIYLFGGYQSNKTARDAIMHFSNNTFTFLQSGTLVIVQNSDRSLIPIFKTDFVHVDIGVKQVFIGNEDNAAVEVEAYIYKDDAWILIQ